MSRRPREPQSRASRAREKTHEVSTRGVLGRNLAPALLLAAAVLAAFYPALDAQFVAWDDDRNFDSNYAFRGLAPANLKWMATTFHMGHYQPLSWLTLGLDYALWGPNPARFHLTNVILHALGAIAFFALARRLLALGLRRTSEPSLTLAGLFAALFFAVHPLRVESVAWVTERRDVLSGLFFTLTVLAYVHWASEPPGSRRTRWYVASIALVLLSLLSKAWAMVMPGVLLLLDVWPLQRLAENGTEVALMSRRVAPMSRRVTRLFVEKIPFFALSAAFALITIVAQTKGSGARPSVQSYGIGLRTLQAGYGAIFYPWKTLLPLDLVPIYEVPRPEVIAGLRFVACTIGAASITIALIALRKRWPAACIAWLAFLVIFAPVSGLMQAGPQLVADRYSYLACMPFALLAGGGLWTWMSRSARTSIAALLAAAAIAITLGSLTFQQTKIWKDSQTFWEYVYAKDPDSQNACDHMGQIRSMQAREAADVKDKIALVQDSVRFFQRAYAISPHPNTLVNMGVAYGLMAEWMPERHDEILKSACEQIERGIYLAKISTGIKPGWRRSHAAVLLDLGRNAEALSELETARAAEPDSVPGLRLLAEALIAVDRTPEALAHLERALQLEPRDASAWLWMGKACDKSGKKQRAKSAFQNAIQLKEKELGARAADDKVHKDAREALAKLGA